MKRIISFFLPKEVIFFDLFEKEVRNSVCASEELRKFFNEYDHLRPAERRKRAQRIKDFEHEGDSITREIMENLHTAFITPIDHEDIHELAVRLDDSVDMVDTLAKKIIYYKLAKMPEPLKKQVEILCEQMKEVEKEIAKLRHGGKIKEEHKRIHELENVADVVHGNAMEDLFDNQKDPMEVIKLKDLYESAEHITDKAQHISIILDGIVIRNA